MPHRTLSSGLLLVTLVGTGGTLIRGAQGATTTSSGIRGVPVVADGGEVLLVDFETVNWWCAEGGRDPLFEWTHVLLIDARGRLCYERRFDSERVRIGTERRRRVREHAFVQNRLRRGIVVLGDDLSSELGPTWLILDLDTGFVVSRPRPRRALGEPETLLEIGAPMEVRGTPLTLVQWYRSPAAATGPIAERGAHLVLLDADLAVVWTDRSDTPREVSAGDEPRTFRVRDGTTARETTVVVEERAEAPFTWEVSVSPR